MASCMYGIYNKLPGEYEQIYYLLKLCLFYDKGLFLLQIKGPKWHCVECVFFKLTKKFETECSFIIPKIEH